MDEARKFPPIKALRDAYRALGNDPTRYRGSNEALVRRIPRAKPLPGQYGRGHQQPDDPGDAALGRDVRPGSGAAADHFRIGQPGESYSGIGRGEIKIEGLPVFADQLGPFGSTTSDSQRTMVQLETTSIMMVVISFLGTRDGSRLAAGGRVAKAYAAARESRRGVVVYERPAAQVYPTGNAGGG